MVLLSLAFAGVARAALAAAPVDERIFAGKGPGETASVLVVMREQTDLSAAEAIADPEGRRRFVFEALRAQAEISQRPLVERLGRAGLRYRSFYLVNMLEVEADRSLANELARRADVSSLAANLPAALAQQPRFEEAERRSSLSTPSTVEPNVAKIRAPEVWAMGFTGQGIVVGVADTGLTWDHPALKPHYRGFDGVSVSHDYNWHDAVHNAASGNMCGSDSPSPCDDDTDAGGHGTATSGLIVGDEGDSKIGVAPGARLIACRNMDAGDGTPARYAECFEFFLAPTDRNGQNPRPDLGAHVINNSWGCWISEGCTDPNLLKAVVENTRAAGLFIVTSAGNDGRLGCSSVSDPPAIYEASFSVGAITLDDAIADYSSRGPVTRDGSGRLKPDVVAPGVLVRTSARPSGYQLFSGTSASSPHVAGAVALLWSAVPSLRGQPSESADILRHASTPLTSLQTCGSFPGAAVPNAVFGWGRIDIKAAVAQAVPTPRARPQPPARLPRTPRALPPRGQ
ncbi:MAG: S8 family serine peptidase [Thermoanaerobaculia bacterium]